jgi:hypothetical protein
MLTTMPDLRQRARILSSPDVGHRVAERVRCVSSQRCRSLLGASRLPAEYRFVSAQGTFDRVGYPPTTDVLDKMGWTLGTVVAGRGRPRLCLGGTVFTGLTPPQKRAGSGYRCRR